MSARRLVRKARVALPGALKALRSLPAGCALHPVTDDNTEPLLRCGEFAIVDTNDRDPVASKLYVIEQSSPLSPGGKRRRIVQVCVLRGCELEDGSPPLMVGPYARNQYVPGVGATRLLDGAFTAQGLRSQLVGRVVGRLAPPADAA